MYKQESEKVSSGRDASKSPRAPAGTGGRLGVPAYKGAPQERDQPLQGIGALGSVDALRVLCTAPEPWAKRCVSSHFAGREWGGIPTVAGLGLPP